MSNLLPPEQKKSILRLYRMRFLALCFMFLTGLALAGCILLLPSIFLSKESESVLTAKRDKLAGNDTSAITKSLAATISDINSRLGVFSSTNPVSPIVADFFDPVLAAKSSAVHLTNLSYTLAAPTTATIQISGDADSREDLLAFEDTLAGIKTFSDVTVPISSFIKDSDVTFTISANVTLK